MESNVTLAWWYNTTWDDESNKFTVNYVIK